MHQDTKSTRLIAVCKRSFSNFLALRYVYYTLRLIGPISYLGACYIRTKVTKCIRKKMTLHFVGGPSNHMHQDTKLTRVCKRCFKISAVNVLTFVYQTYFQKFSRLTFVGGAANVFGRRDNAIFVKFPQFDDIRKSQPGQPARINLTNKPYLLLSW